MNLRPKYPIYLYKGKHLWIQIWEFWHCSFLVTHHGFIISFGRITIWYMKARPKYAHPNP